MTELEIYRLCLGLGMTPAGAAGCTANILHESNGRADNVENTCPLSDEDYTKGVDNGTYTNFVNDHYGYGICQWTYYTRKEALLKYAKEHGVSIADANMQFQFMARELRESYAYVWSTLITTSDPYTAGYVMCEKFERPKGGETSAKQRGQKAKEIYDRCKNAGVETVYYDKQKLIDWGYSQIGYHEGDNNWNKYAEIMDKVKDFYNGIKQNQPYCDIWYDCGCYVCYGREAALYLTCQPEKSCGAGCKFSAQYYQAKGRFFKSGPETADQIFFGSGWDNVRHTGMVVEVSDTHVTTIEGNTSDQVAKRVYRINDPNIFGYGRPRWGTPTESSDTSTGSNTTKPEMPQKPAQKPVEQVYTYNVKLPLLQIGDNGGYVQAAQTLLIARGYSCGGRKFLGRETADGDFGTSTEKAVGQFQGENGLEKDGEIGGATWAALLKFD